MKMKCVFFAALAAIGLLVAGSQNASAVLIYGVVWIDTNNNGLRDDPDLPEGEKGYDGAIVTLLRDNVEVGHRETAVQAATTYTGGVGTFNAAKGGYYMDFTYSAPADTYTLQLNLPSNYNLSAAHVSAPGYNNEFQGFVTGDGSSSGRFGLVTGVSYAGDAANASGFDSDVLASGTMGYWDLSLSDNGQIIRVDVGLVPVPEPANIALGIFGALALGYSALRHLRNRKVERLAPVVA